MPRKIKRPGCKPGPVPLPPGEAQRRKSARNAAYKARPEYKEQRKRYAFNAKIRFLVEEEMKTCQYGSKKLKILEEFKNHPNKTNQQVAEDTGCSYHYVRTWARKLGRSKWRMGEDQFSVQIFDQLKNNPKQNYIELAKSLGCDKSTVCRVAIYNLGIRTYRKGNDSPRRPRAKCGQNSTVPHDHTTITLADIAPAE